MRKFLQFSRIQLGALTVVFLIGLLVGSTFLWAAPPQAWDYTIAGFLWVLLIAAGSGLVRAFRERIKRGEWQRCLALGCEMTFPLTTMYILGMVLASAGAAETALLANGTSVAGKPDLLVLVPVYYSVTLIIALLLGPAYMLTSPFGRVARARQPVSEREHTPHV